MKQTDQTSYIDRTSFEPAYVQLVNILHGQIASGSSDRESGCLRSRNCAGVGRLSQVSLGIPELLSGLPA